MPKRPHQWLIEWNSTAKKQLVKLSSNNRMRVFASIAEIAKANNPSQVTGVNPYKAERDHNVWKLRQGDYRIFFTFDTVEVVRLKFRYKGILSILAIRIHHTGYDKD